MVLKNINQMFFIGQHSKKKLKNQSRTKSFQRNFRNHLNSDLTDKNYHKKYLKRQSMNRNGLFSTKFVSLTDESCKEDRYDNLILTKSISEQFDLASFKQKILWPNQDNEKNNNSSMNNLKDVSTYSSTKNLDDKIIQPMYPSCKTNRIQNKSRFHTSRQPKRQVNLRNFVCEMNLQLKQNYDKNLQKLVKFNNSLISYSFLKKKKLCHSAKISKCLTIGEPDEVETKRTVSNQFANIQITGLKAPCIETIDHLRLRTKTSSRSREVKFSNEEISKWIEKNIKIKNQNEGISRII